VADNLFDALDQYETVTLHAILTFQGYKVPGPGRLSKPELVRTLQKLLTEPSRVVRAYAGLSRPAREALVTLQRQGGSATRGAIRRRLRDLNLLEARETRLDTYSSQQPDFRRSESRFIDEILAHLTASGLIFGRISPDPWGRRSNLTFHMALEYFIPAQILSLLPAPPALPPELPDLGTPEKILESSSRVFQRDLYLYWSYVYHNQPELIAKGLLAKRHLTAVNDTLLQRETIATGQSEADFPRLLFLRLMLIQLGLVRTEEFSLQAGPGEAFFGASPLERIRRTFEAYVTGRQLNELALHNPISAYGERLVPAPDRLVDARKALVLFFRLAVHWTGLEALIGRVRETAYEFLLPRIYRSNNSQSYYYPTVHPYSQFGNPLGWDWSFSPSMDEGEGWRRVEAQWIQWMVAAPFFWMGLVNLGFHDPKGAGPDCFYLTAPGRWLLAGGAAPEIPQEGGQVIVQPDYTLLAFDPISDAVLFHLEQFASRVSAERATLFRMSQASVYAGQQAGWSAARIQAYLEELSAQPLPANVARTLQEWQTAHERISIMAHVNVLHAPHVADLDLLSEQKKAVPLLKQRPAPGVVVLPEGRKLGEIHRELSELGWWPVVTSREAGLPSHAVVVDEEGRLAFVQRQPGLYLRAHLARFAEPQGDGFCLTPASIRRAANAGLTAAQMVAELNRVLVKPLSPPLEQRLQAWSGHFGQAQVEDVALLRFKNETALADLLRDPDISRLLRTFRPAELDQTAVVRAKDVEKLRALLEERGVEWRDG
jgi:hypothetical protein